MRFLTALSLILPAACGSRTTLAEVDIDLEPGVDASIDAPSERDGVVVDVGRASGWRPIGNPPTTFLGRQEHAAVWTGREMIVATGRNLAGRTTYLADAMRYDPTSDSWSSMSAFPLAARAVAAYAWTGAELLVWGGSDAGGTFRDGAAYDPALGTWSLLPPPPASFRARHECAFGWVADTGELVIWGGNARASGSRPEALADGAAYQPRTRTWRLLPAGPLGARALSGFAVLGRSLVIHGGSNFALATNLDDGAEYDALTNSWSSLPRAPTPGRAAPLLIAGARDEVFVFGGFREPSEVSEPALFDRGSDTWQGLPDPTVGIEPPRVFAKGFFASGRYHVWGGLRRAPALGDGFIWDTASRTWSAMPTSNAPAPRYHHSVVWTGEEAIFWGGNGRPATPTSRADGAAFRP